MSREFQPYHIYDRLVVWLDGNDPNGNNRASVPTNGQNVLKWYDKSPNGFVFSASDSDAPTYNTAGKKLVFDGTEHLSCTGINSFPSNSDTNDAGLILNEGFHLFIAGSLTNVSDSQVDVILSGKTSDGSGDFTFVKESGSNIACALDYKAESNGAATTATSPITVTSGSQAIFEVLVDSTNGTIPDVNNCLLYTSPSPRD